MLKPWRLIPGMVGALIIASATTACSSTLAGQGTPDSSTAFAVFARPERPSDTVPPGLWNSPVTPWPSTAVHIDRRVATNRTLNVYPAHADPDWLCLVTDERPGQSAAGGESCTPGSQALANGFWMSWQTGGLDADHDRTAVMVPDGYTAVVSRGTLVLVGQGALVAQGNGVEITLTNAGGHTQQLVSPHR
jgi:hypothetical protein